MSLEIRHLADMPGSIPVLAEWFVAEWQRYDGRSRAEIELQLHGNLNRDTLPVTFVALKGDELVGTVSLDLTDLPSYDHFSPWLASLYVVPTHRQAGIGRALVQHAVVFARLRGISPLYLWTPGATHLYESCGFQFLCRDTYASDPIALTSLPIALPRRNEIQ